MLKLLGIVLFFIGIVHYTPCHLNYYSDGIDDRVVLASIQQWKLKDVHFNKTSNKQEADILFRLVAPNKMSAANKWGEHFGNTILINNSIKFNSKELTNLLSHEFGHYLFLEHNNFPCSIMNPSVPLTKRKITEDNLWFVTERILAAKLIDKFYWFVS